MANNRAVSIFFLAATTAIFLILAFPRASYGFMAWVALVPLLFAISLCHKRIEAFLAGLTAGVLFFAVSISWLTNVTGIGWFLLSVFEALFVAVFAWFTFEIKGMRFFAFRVLWIAAAWTSTEILRTEIPVFGLGWNLLAYTQSGYLTFLQAANTVGAYGLGFFIAGVNAGLFEIFRFNHQLRISKENRKQNTVFGCILIAAILLFFFLLQAHGKHHLRQEDGQSRTLRIALIQGNIPQLLKWEAMAKDKIIEIYSKLTQLASYDEPDLIVWPEAAYPGYLNADVEAAGIIELIQKIQIPALIGSPHWENPTTVFNSSYFIASDGTIQARYDKLFLVPFGEYIPLKPVFGWLEPYAYSLGVGDFTAGREYRIFRTELQVPFAALICFEDVLPHVARRFVQNGAQFLALMTNDAWFGRSAAPYQHLQASIFRAVENGVSIVRAANTGVSAFISPRGKVLGRVSDFEGNDIFITGRATAEIPVNVIPTLYRQGGYFFSYLIFILFAVSVLFVRVKKRGSVTGS